MKINLLRNSYACIHLTKEPFNIVVTKKKGRDILSMSGLGDIGTPKVPDKE